MRVFLAISLPRRIKQEIGEVEKSLRSIFPHRGTKWVKEENLHLTLVFLGNLSRNKLTLIRERLRKIKPAPFSLSLAGLGFFPHRNSPRVVWLGVGGERKKLFSLYSQIVTSLKGEGFLFPLDFVPHITLARIEFFPRKKIVLNKDFIHKGKLSKKFFVHSFVLIQSETRPEGAQYKLVEEFFLG